MNTLVARPMSLRVILWMSVCAFALMSLTACNASRYAVHGFGMDMESAGQNLQQWTPIAQPQEDVWNGNQSPQSASVNPYQQNDPWR